MAPSATIKLNNGTLMPQFGLGTWLTEPGEAAAAVQVALDEGYRLIDTATLYQNEEEIGDALANYFATGKLKREDVFITTKLCFNYNRPEDVEPQLRGSLKKLRLDYVNLYLIHNPVTFDRTMQKHDTSVKVEDTWKAMEKVYRLGLTKAIGVSNFNDDQIARILRSGSVPVHNSQVELHLYFLQKQHRRFCQRNNIAVTAYAPMGSPGRHAFVMPDGTKSQWAPALVDVENEEAKRLGQKYKKSVAQILLRHLLQSGVAIIPKSVNAGRIRENALIGDFELTDDEVAALNAQPQAKRVFTHDFAIGHPEDPWIAERKA